MGWRSFLTFKKTKKKPNSTIYFPVQIIMWFESNRCISSWILEQRFHAVCYGHGIRSLIRTAWGGHTADNQITESRTSQKGLSESKRWAWRCLPRTGQRGGNGPGDQGKQRTPQPHGSHRRGDDAWPNGTLNPHVLLLNKWRFRFFSLFDPRVGGIGVVIGLILFHPEFIIYQHNNGLMISEKTKISIKIPTQSTNHITINREKVLDTYLSRRSKRTPPCRVNQNNVELDAILFWKKYNV